jgi:ABC-2 type transport system permease protein
MSELLHRIAALFRKELLAILNDRSSRAILIVPAIMQSLIFGYAATFDLGNVPYAVLDSDHSRTAAQLIARLDSTRSFHRVADLESASQIAPAIDSMEALMVVRIGPGFEADLAAGRAAPVQLILDARNSTTATSASAYVSMVVDAFNAERRAHAGLAAVGPLTVETRAWFNPQLESRWNLVPALVAALSMLQTLLLTALSVAREREQGTFDQLLVTPLSPTEIMIGKALPPVLIGLVQATLVLCVSLFWFRIPMAGSLGTLYLGLLVFMLAGVGIGLAISALSATMQQAMFSTFVLLMPMMLLSGLTTPVGNMPRVLQIATVVNPLRFGIDFVRRVYLEGVGFATVWPDLVPLAILAAISLPSAAWLFRNRLI